MPEITEEKIKTLLSQINHPVIESNIVKLGIVKKIHLERQTVTLTLAFPFLGASTTDIAVRKEILKNVKSQLKNLGLKVKLKQKKMSQEEFKTFLDIEQQTWNDIFG